MNEMNFRDSTRYTGMLDNIGRICTFFLDYNFKHSLGRWQRGMVDEAAAGSSLILWSCGCRFVLSFSLKY